MPSIYIEPSEYSTYGLPDDTTTGQVQAASSLLDGYLKRQEGLVWGPDYLGLPCYMAGAGPTMTFIANGAITHGTNVVVPLTKAIPASHDMIGDVVIVNRADDNKVEACVISAVADGQVTLASVANDQPSGATLEFGMVITEQRAIPSKRSIARVTRSPVRLLSGLGRYGYGRRTDQIAGLYSDINLLASLQAFGGPPDWVSWDVRQASVSQVTNEIWVPSGVYLAYYSEIRVRYISGYSFNSLPDAVKQVVARGVLAVQQYPDFVGNVKVVKAGDTAIERFSATVIDADTRTMLQPLTCRLVI